MKAAPKKKSRARHVKHKRAASLGLSPVTGARVFTPVTKGASISLDDVRRVVRTLKTLTVERPLAATSPDSVLRASEHHGAQ